MIKNILFPVALIFVVILGGVSADFLRNRQNDKVSDTSAPVKTKKSASHGSKDDGHAPKKSKKKKGKKDSHGKDQPDNITAASTYMKFKRQFVVPVMKGGRIESLVLLNLNLELGPDAPSNAYTLEPKLRDSIMRELLALSHSGVFANDLTSADTYDKLRAALLLASESVITEGVENVLILDLARQDQ